MISHNINIFLATNENGKANRKREGGKKGLAVTRWTEIGNLMCKNEQGSTKGKNQLLMRIHLLRDAHMSKDPIAFSGITDEKAMQSTVSSMKVARPTSMAFVDRFHVATTMMSTGYVVHGGEYWRGQPREATLLQSLPRPLPGSVTAKHVGSAVPPPLAKTAVEGGGSMFSAGGGGEVG